MAESLPTCPLNLGKVCNLSEPQFPYFSNVIIRPFVPETHNAIWAKPKSRVNVMAEETLNNNKKNIYIYFEQKKYKSVPQRVFWPSCVMFP